MLTDSPFWVFGFLNCEIKCLITLFNYQYVQFLSNSIDPLLPSFEVSLDRHRQRETSRCSRAFRGFCIPIKFKMSKTSEVLHNNL